MVSSFNFEVCHCGFPHVYEVESEYLIVNTSGSVINETVAKSTPVMQRLRCRACGRALEVLKPTTSGN